MEPAKLPTVETLQPLPMLLCWTLPAVTPTRAVELAPRVDRMFQKGQASTPRRKAMMLGNVAVESDQFRAQIEYWDPVKVPAQARYEGSSHLGNIHPGDGYRFRGHGWIELTGRANFEKYGALSGLPIVEHPELAADPDNSADIAGLFWAHEYGGALLLASDLGDVKRVCHILNGGENGLAERTEYYKKALQFFGLPE